MKASLNRPRGAMPAPTWLLALAWVLTLLAGCDYSDAPQAAPLRELAAHPGEYQAALVATTGVVRGFADPEHYWIEDEALNRVELEPREQARAHLDRQVQVIGTFHYDPARGRLIQVREFTGL